MKKAAGTRAGGFFYYYDFLGDLGGFARKLRLSAFA